MKLLKLDFFKIIIIKDKKNDAGNKFQVQIKKKKSRDSYSRELIDFKKIYAEKQCRR